MEAMRVVPVRMTLKMVSNVNALRTLKDGFTLSDVIRLAIQEMIDRNPEVSPITASYADEKRPMPLFERKKLRKVVKKLAKKPVKRAAAKKK